VVTESQLVHAAQLRRAGHTIAEITATTGLTHSTLYRHLPAREPEPLTAAPITTGQVGRRPPAAPGSRLACPSCGHQPASRAEACQHRAEMARSCGCTWMAAASPRPATVRSASPTSTSSTWPAPTVVTPVGHRTTPRPRRPPQRSGAGLATRPRLANPASAVVPSPRHLTCPEVDLVLVIPVLPQGAHVCHHCHPSNRRPGPGPL
jgi:hypothetical protein